jgi:hypothetical protein
VSDVTGPHSLTGPERAIDSAYIHVTVPDGTVAAQLGLTPADDPHSGDDAATGHGQAAAGGGVAGGDVSGAAGFSAEHGFAGGRGLEAENGTVVPSGHDAGPPPIVAADPPPFEECSGALAPATRHPQQPAATDLPAPMGPPSPLDHRTPPGQWDDQRFPGIVRGDLLELAGRLEQLDQLLGRLEEAKRQAADASEHLMLTRRWQEETVRTIQEERARMRQRQHALDELAERARAAVEAMQATYRTLPREVIELAIELQVLDRAGFVSRRANRPRPDDVT